MNLVAITVRLFAGLDFPSRCDCAINGVDRVLGALPVPSSCAQRRDTELANPVNPVSYMGIPLPLASYGGSSLIALMASMGLLISVNPRTFFPWPGRSPAGDRSMAPGLQPDPSPQRARRQRPAAICQRLANRGGGNGFFGRFTRGSQLSYWRVPTAGNTGVNRPHRVDFSTPGRTSFAGRIGEFL